MIKILYKLYNMPFFRIIKMSLNFILVVTGFKTLHEFISDLGPFYVKMAQLAVTRPDVFSQNIIQRLLGLTDHVSSQAVVYQDIVYHQPLASGSIAQVFELDERRVIKIKRDDSSIRDDANFVIALLGVPIFRWLSKKISIVRCADKLTEMIQTTLPEHLNFVQEVNNMRYYKTIAGDIILPDVYEYDSQTIVMQKINGKTLDQIDNPELALRQLSQHVIDVLLRHNVIHGDIHPGNILVTETGVALLDFAVVHRISTEKVLLLYILFQAIKHGQVELLAKTICSNSTEQVQDKFNQEIQQNISSDLYRTINVIVQTCLKYDVIMDESLLPALNSLAQLDGVCKRYCQQDLFSMIVI